MGQLMNMNYTSFIPLARWPLSLNLFVQGANTKAATRAATNKDTNKQQAEQDNCKQTPS